MTIPSERYRSMRNVRYMLLNSAISPGRISKREFREMVRRILRHYPSDSELKVMAKRCPELLKSDKATHHEY